MTEEARHLWQSRHAATLPPDQRLAFWYLVTEGIPPHRWPLEAIEEIIIKRWMAANGMKGNDRVVTQFAHTRRMELIAAATATDLHYEAPEWPLRDWIIRGALLGEIIERQREGRSWKANTVCEAVAARLSEPSQAHRPRKDRHLDISRERVRRVFDDFKLELAAASRACAPLSVATWNVVYTVVRHIACVLDQIDARTPGRKEFVRGVQILTAGIAHITPTKLGLGGNSDGSQHFRRNTLDPPPPRIVAGGRDNS
ncbi:hypothetical protein J8I29_19330 [Labrys sp. LIt4]|uniref:hypothetical protein n=1 Tax=Labrys sp. LIt4 TaxID=2821355 RepID=UPI001ADF7BC5|nr:hypothetical protein [Labrys sp. LIt4]MBP0581490.1 hypothetical protein [Labrys sp. LIt4]